MNTTEAAAVTICPFCREERSVFHSLRYEYEIDGTTYKITMPHLLEHIFTTSCYETHVKRMNGKIEPKYMTAIGHLMLHMEKMDKAKDNYTKHFGEEETKKPSKVLYRIISEVNYLVNIGTAPEVVMLILDAMNSGEPSEEVMEIITENYEDLWEHLKSNGVVGWYARGSIISKAKAVRTQRARKERAPNQPTPTSDGDDALPARRDLIVELIKGKDDERDAKFAKLEAEVAEMKKMVGLLIRLSRDDEAPTAVDPIEEPRTPRIDIPEEEEEPTRIIIKKKKSKNTL
jgi:hypothetical protein